MAGCSADHAIRADPRVNCREATTHSRPHLLGFSLVKAGNVQFSEYELLSTNSTMSDPHTASTNALIA